MAKTDECERGLGSLLGSLFLPSWWPLLWGIAVVGAGLRQPLPPHPSTVTGLSALADTILHIGLWGYLVLLGAAVGRWALRPFHLPIPSREVLIWALPTGLTLLGYPVYALGLMGYFQREWLAILLLGLTLGWHREMHAIAQEGRLWLCTLWQQKREHSRWMNVRWGLLAALLGGSFLLSLTPPWLYDALWYHLQAPRLFLEAGRIYPEWNNWPANYAFAVNMLYALPMALGSDVVPRMLHWTYGGVFLLLLYSMARTKAEKWAWLAPAFLLTTPNFLSVLAPSGLIDVASATLEGMAYGGLLRALQNREIRWFWASALWAGLAVSIKLAALPVLATVGLMWLWRGFPSRFSQRLSSLIRYGLLALVVMAPWYLKNLLWFGTPVFPTGLVGDAETMLRAHLFSSYTMAAQMTGWKRLTFLAWLVSQPQKLGYMPPPFAVPILLLLFVPKPARGIIPAVVGIRILFWVLGPPRIRFLLAAFGLGGIALAHMVNRGWAAHQALFRIRARGIVLVILSVLFLNLLLEFLTLWSIRPWQVILGWESREAFLLRRVDGYKGWVYIRENLKEKDSVLLVGDARHYYCPIQCYPEADHFTWTRWTYLAQFDVEKTLERLRTQGISYVWLHHSSISWLLDHDPGGAMKRSYAFLQDVILPQCGQIVYQDSEVALVHLTCLREKSTP